MMKFETFIATFAGLQNSWWGWFSQSIGSNADMWQWTHKVWIIQGNKLYLEDMTWIADRIKENYFFSDENGDFSQDLYDAYVARWVDDA